MNKLAKGALAAGVATALFLGGGTTLALWNDHASVGSGKEINTGVLTLNATSGTWSDNPDLWVPGDSFTYTTTASIVAKGEHLASRLSIDPTSITGDPDLKAALTTTMTVDTTSGGTFTPVSGQANTFDVLPDNLTSGSPITAKITITVDFPKNSVSNKVAQGATVQLSGLELLLTQVRS